MQGTQSVVPAPLSHGFGTDTGHGQVHHISSMRLHSTVAARSTYYASKQMHTTSFSQNISDMTLRMLTADLKVCTASIILIPLELQGVGSELRLHAEG